MYTKYFNFLLIIFLSIIFLNCETKKKSIDTSGNITPVVPKVITVYGSENCDHCIEFRKKADSLKINYTFKDAEANEMYMNELMQKLQQINYGGYVRFPVIQINEKLYVRPEFDDFLVLVNK